MLERLDDDFVVHACSNVRIGIGPGLRRSQRFEFGNDQATAETGFARVVAVDGWVWAGQHHAAFGLELLQAFDVRRAAARRFSREFATSLAMMA